MTGPTERELRVDLAARYRLAALFGWDGPREEIRAPVGKVKRCDDAGSEAVAAVIDLAGYREAMGR